VGCSDTFSRCWAAVNDASSLDVAMFAVARDSTWTSTIDPLGRILIFFLSIRVVDSSVGVVVKELTPDGSQNWTWSALGALIGRLVNPINRLSDCRWQTPRMNEDLQKDAMIARKKDKNIQQAGFPDGHPL
jgi:hypothetical protein